MKERIKKILCNLDIGVAGAALVVLVTVTFANVVMRRAFNHPIQWTEEVQKACFLWITYIGAGAVFRNGGHVAIDIIVDLFPEKLQKIIELIGLVITVYVIGNFFVQSLTLVQQFAAMGRETNLLKIPYVYIYSAIPAGCVTMLLSVAAVEFKKFKGQRTKEEKE